MIKKNIHLLLIIALICLLSIPASAQKGQYINPYGIYQSTSINNRKDYFTSDDILNLKNSYHFAYGIQYISNFTDIFGIETGLKHSTTGQKYYGFIDYDANTQITEDINYTSEVLFNFYHVPFLLRFNSPLDEDRIFLTIAAGFQADILSKTQVITDPAPVIPPAGIINYNELFSSFNVSFVSNAMFTISITEKIHTSIGFQMARSIGDVENKKFEFDKTIHPVEYYFPVSTKKNDRPVFSPNSSSGRQKSKLTNYGLLVGLSFLIKS